MSMNGLRIGAIALVTGGALTGALLFGVAFASAQTADDTPVAEDSETPTETTPSGTPQTDQAPSDGTDTDKGTPNDTTTPDGDRPMHDGECDKDGEGRPEAGMRGNGEMRDGVRFSGAGQRGGLPF